MSQFDFGTINPVTKNGTELATDLNTWRDAVHSQHSGTSRPAYAAAGTLWLDTTTTTWVMNLYDGADDIVLFNINTVTNSAQFAGDTLSLTDSGTTTTLSVVRTGTPPTTELAIFEDQAVANNFSNVKIKAHRPGVIWEDATPGDHFRWGVDANLFKLSIDNDNDLAKGAAGHFDDIENAIVVDGVTGKVGMGSSDLLAAGLHIETSSAGAITPSSSADELILEGSGNSGLSIFSGVVNHGNVFFGDSGSGSQGIIRYHHNTDTMSFWTVVNERMSIGSDGKVKIGVVEVALGLLHIETSSAGAISPTVGGDELVLENSGNCGMTIYSGTTNAGNIFFGDSGSDSAGIIQYHHNTNDMSFWSAAIEWLTATSTLVEFNVGNLGTMDFIINGVTAGAMTFTADGGDGGGLFNFDVPIRANNGFQIDDSPASETIATGGEITIDQETYAITLTAQSGTTDNLDEIVGGAAGQIIALEATGAGGGHTITVRNEITPSAGGQEIITQAQGNKTIDFAVSDVMYLQHMGGSWKQIGGTV